MRVQVSIIDDQAEEITSLYRWLCDDPDVRREMAPDLKAASTGQGDMGGGLDVIELVINEGVPIGTLGVAIMQWLRPRSARPSINLTRADTNVVVTDGQAESFDRALAELARRVKETNQE